MPLPPLENPKAPIDRAAATLKALPSVVFMSTSLLGLNAAQSASVLLLPVSRNKFRAFNRWAANLWWGWCVQLAERMHGTGVVLSGDEVPERENAIVVANHQQMPDITFLMFLARDKQRLGDMKWMLKDVIKYVPGVGWGLLFLDNFFVKRDWTADHNAIEKTFARILRDDVPIWLMTFAEGTRVTPAKIARSQQYARDKGLPEPEHVLLPRTKGFVAAVQGLRSHLDAVYDVTIGYQGGVPTLWQYILGYCRQAHLHVRRYPIADLPEADGEIASWLYARYHEKDRLLEEFYRHGQFQAGF